MGTAVLVALMQCAALAQGTADAYPSRPIVTIIPFAAGGTYDREFQFYSPRLAQLLGKPFVVDFKPGAANTIGAGYVARARPDGYTLLAVSTSLTIAQAMNPNLGFDLTRDFAPVTLIDKSVPILVANANFGPRDFREYLAHVRENPDRVNFGTSGQGGSGHLASAWLHNMAKAKVTFIHYKGAGPQLLDLAAGRVDVTVVNLFGSLPLIKAGKIRPIANLDEKRTKNMPDLPTVAEQGLPDFSFYNWLGIAAPVGVSPRIITRLSEAFATVVKMPEVAGPIEAQGVEMVGSSPEQLRVLIAVEIERWRRVAKDNGIQAEN